MKIEILDDKTWQIVEMNHIEADVLCELPELAKNAFLAGCYERIFPLPLEDEYDFENMKFTDLFKDFDDRKTKKSNNKKSKNQLKGEELEKVLKQQINSDWDEYVIPELEKEFLHKIDTVKKELKSLRTQVEKVIKIMENASSSKKKTNGDKELELIESNNFEIKLAIKNATAWLITLNLARIALYEINDIPENVEEILKNKQLPAEPGENLEEEVEALFPYFCSEFYGTVQNFIVEEILEDEEELEDLRH